MRVRVRAKRSFFFLWHIERVESEHTLTITYRKEWEMGLSEECLSRSIPLLRATVDVRLGGLR